jgi:hypothetical protein
MAQPCNPARDTLALSAAMPGGFQYRVGTNGVRSMGSHDVECLAR